MPEVKIDGTPVEASVEGEGRPTTEKKEEKEVKKPGKAKKIIGIIAGSIVAAGAVGIGFLKFMAAKDSAPELNSGSSYSDGSASSDADDE